MGKSPLRSNRSSGRRGSLASPPRSACPITRFKHQLLVDTLRASFHRVSKGLKTPARTPTSIYPNSCQSLLTPLGKASGPKLALICHQSLNTPQKLSKQCPGKGVALLSILKSYVNPGLLQNKVCTMELLVFCSFRCTCLSRSTTTRRNNISTGRPGAPLPWLVYVKRLKKLQSRLASPPEGSNTPAAGVPTGKLTRATESWILHFFPKKQARSQGGLEVLVAANLAFLDRSLEAFVSTESSQK